LIASGLDFGFVPIIIGPPNNSFEGYKTVLILETPFWVAGAAESIKTGIIVIGPSNKSGPHCMHARKKRAAV
jgi:hypothetical protein